jgi:hypothetical protein
VNVKIKIMRDIGDDMTCLAVTNDRIHAQGIIAMMAKSYEADGCTVERVDNATKTIHVSGGKASEPITVWMHVDEFYYEDEDPTIVHLLPGEGAGSYDIAECTEKGDIFATFTSSRALKTFLDAYSLACVRLCDCNLTVVNHTKVDLSGLTFVDEQAPSTTPA